MTLQTNAPPPLLVALGIVLLAGAAILAWFSATATLHLTRTGDAAAATVLIVRADFEERLFGLIPIASERIDGIRSVSVVSAGAPDSTSRTNTSKRLVFDTAAGPVDRGYTQQRFSRDYPAIRDFFASESQREFTVSSAGTFWEALRFIAAQVGVLFLAALGLLLIYLGMRGLFPDPNAGIGPV